MRRVTTIYTLFPYTTLFRSWAAATVASDTDDATTLSLLGEKLTSRSHGMQLGYYDTKTNKFVGVDTSYNTHHLQFDWQGRSEEHTSELQSQSNLVCRLLLEK